MQTLSDIRALLDSHGLAPQKQFGQCFLHDANLMAKLLELADVPEGATVLEVGPGTGSLSEELLDRAGKLVAVEIDHGLARLLREQFAGRDNFVLLERDVLAGKHQIAPDVLAEVAPACHLVANLPYNIATPLIAQCLIESWRSCTQAAGVRFDRLTFTVQREVGDRLAAEAGMGEYGPVSVLTGLLGEVTLGPGVPNSAFWPRPKVASRIVRIDFHADRVGAIDDIDVLSEVLSLAFGQRRKQLGSVVRRKDAPFAVQTWQDALAGSGIDASTRAEQVPPDALAELANRLASTPPG